MTEQIKQRIVGALVLLALLAIFLPLFFSEPHPMVATDGMDAKVPPSPTKPVVELRLPQLEHKSDQTAPGLLAAKPQEEGEPPTQLASNGTASVSLSGSPMPDGPAAQPVDSNTQPSNAPQVPTIAASAVIQKEPEKRLVSATPGPEKPLASATLEPAAPLKAPAIHAQKNLNDTAWVIQVASFKESLYADRLLKQLRRGGYEAYTRPTIASNGQPLIKVYIGPFIDIDKAKKLQPKIRQDFHLQGLLRRFQA